METLILSLIGWLNLYTDYDTRVDLPNIVVTEPGNLCRTYGIADAATCEASRLKGYYDEQLTIYLYAGFDPDNPNDQARLLHELVHYLQWHSGEKRHECRGRLEIEAYRLQGEWRELHGLPDSADPFTLMMLEAACNDI